MNAGGRLRMSIVQALPRPGGNANATEVNVVMIKGVLTEEPAPDSSRSGEPVTLLTLGFAAPDAKDENERWASASCTVEISSRLAGQFDGGLHKGAAVLVAGQLVGGGDVLATALCLEPAPATARPGS